MQRLQTYIAVLASLLVLTMLLILGSYAVVAEGAKPTIFVVMVPLSCLTLGIAFYLGHLLARPLDELREHIQEWREGNSDLAAPVRKPGFMHFREARLLSDEANALIKARAAAASGYIGVGDDSGLCVEALGGAPGVYSARYAGEQGDDEANLDLVLEHMKGKTDRRAAFVCCIACAFPDGSEPIIAQGRVDGELLEARAGEGGFGYDPIFYYPPFGATFGETSAEQKNTVSHRARALAAFAEALRERLAENQ
jgi:XTP/dITP diphosphohydrolase